MIKIKEYSDKKWLKLPEDMLWEWPAAEMTEETLEWHMESMKSQPRYDPIKIMKYLVDSMAAPMEEEMPEIPEWEIPMGDLMM